MRPDRILLAEVRGDEAFDYLRNVASGHPGSITSVHAGTCELALEQLALLVRQSDAGRGLARAEVIELLHALVDVVVQCAVVGGRRVISEIWYRPDLKRRRVGGGQ
jgi:type IV secretion system protein VirB11